MSTKETPAADAQPKAYSPTDALDAALRAAYLASPILHKDDVRGRMVVAHPESVRITTVDDPYSLPPRIGQTVTVDTRESLVNYANRFSCDRSMLVADIDAGTITAHLDWHGHNGDGEGKLAARHDKHRAILRLRDSEEFKRWNEFEGGLHSQVEFAAFLEENAVDVTDPEPTILIEISRDLEVTQGAVFKSSNRLENGDRVFVYETETRVKGEVQVPREFLLQIPLYAGEDTVELRCALRFRPTGEGLKLGFEWRRVEYQRQAYFQSIASAASEQTGLPVIFGRAS